MVSNNLLDNVEELNMNVDIIENDYDENELTQSRCSVDEGWNESNCKMGPGVKSKEIVMLNVRMKCRYKDPVVAFK